MNSSAGPRDNALAIILTAFGVLVPGMACAETGYFIVPSISLIEAYDDNLFFALSGEESDLITRISPALEVGYESDKLNWDAHYRFDAETYSDHSNLDSNLARRFADAELEFSPNSRMTLGAEAKYTKTNTPVDLNLIAGGDVQGLLLGRVDAERTSINPSVSYRITSAVKGSLAYTLTHDKLFGGVEGDTQEVEMDIEQGLNGANTLGYGYIYRKYQFDDPEQNNALSTRQHSHTPWLGLLHKFSPRTSLTARAGPRIYSNSTKPYVLLSMLHQYTGGQILVSYERNETTLLGEVGRLESETFSATIAHEFGPRFSVQVIPGYAKVSRQEFAADIFYVALDARYQINDAVFLTASYNYNFHQVDFIDGRVEEVSRNVVTLGITLTYPRRNSPRRTRELVQ